VQQEYETNFNGVDRKDRDTANFIVTFEIQQVVPVSDYWLFDSCIHSAYIIVHVMTLGGVCTDWKK